MNHSKIYVSYHDGSKPKGTRVSIGFQGLLGGMSQPVYTDRDGVAVVKHASTGMANVYVSGKIVGSFHAPGETAVFI